MTPKFVPGAIYESTTHGLVEFKGVDSYMGESTLHFCSLEDGDCYWTTKSLSMHFAEPMTTSAGLGGYCTACKKPPGECRCSAEETKGALHDGYCSKLNGGPCNCSAANR